MSRPKALLVSAVVALTLISLVVMVGTLLRVSTAENERGTAAPVPPSTVPLEQGPLEVGSDAPPEPVVVYQDVWEVVPGAPTGAGPGASASGAAQEVPVTAIAGQAVPPTPVAPGAPVVGAVAPPATTSPTTKAPAPTTTVAPRPPGVPADWPADKPIPPMPAGCRQPQLEDDGVWNCQH